MLLRHATPRRNLPSIRRLGLLCGKSRGKLPVVWLHSASKSAWCLLHVVKRHGGRVEDAVVIELQVPRGWLRRSRKGLWFCPRDLAPERFCRLIDFAQVSESPVRG
jgi:hypothetical protein